jgi:hypothetical protein
MYAAFDLNEGGFYTPLLAHGIFIGTGMYGSKESLARCDQEGLCPQIMHMVSHPKLIPSRVLKI